MRPKWRQYSIRSVMVMMMLVGVAIVLFRPHRSDIDFVFCGASVQTDEFGQPEYVDFRVRLINRGPDPVWLKSGGGYGFRVLTNGAWDSCSFSQNGAFEKLAPGDSRVISAQPHAEMVLAGDLECDTESNFEYAIIMVGVNTYQGFRRTKKTVWSDRMRVPVRQKVSSEAAKREGS